MVASIPRPRDGAPDLAHDGAPFPGTSGDFGPGLLEAVWQYRVLVAVTCLVEALVGYGISLLQPVQNEATAQLLLANSDLRRCGREPRPSRNVRNHARVVESTPVAVRAIELVSGNLRVHPGCSLRVA